MSFRHDVKTISDVWRESWSFWDERDFSNIRPEQLWNRVDCKLFSHFVDRFRFLEICCLSQWLSFLALVWWNRRVDTTRGTTAIRHRTPPLYHIRFMLAGAPIIKLIWIIMLITISIRHSIINRIRNTETQKRPKHTKHITQAITPPTITTIM